MIDEKDLREYRSIPFWSWNDKLEPEHLREQIRSMKKAGIGGFFMHARGGLQTEYMSDEWMDAVAACVDEAEKQDMNAWAYDENGWPSGFAGMKLLEDPKNHVHYLETEERAFDTDALGCYQIIGNHVDRVLKDNGKPCLCVYDRTNSSAVDILDPMVVRRFLDETHERYYERFPEDLGSRLAGFFTDEPQYFRYGTAYTPQILPAYRGRYGEDLLDELGALYLDCEEAYKIRFRYWRLMNELFTENFAGQIYNWCEAHGCRLTGHAIEERNLFGQMIACAGIMPFYEYEHIPGMDWLGRGIDTEIAPRQVFSAARQLGKEHVLTETFACCGWDVTPKELKRILEWQCVNGVDLLCQHLYPYSIRGQRKRDYPAFYSDHNPWCRKALRTFNDYFTRLGWLLATSDEVTEVAVIHPIHSAYFHYRRDDASTLAPLEHAFASLAEGLGARGIQHHFVDECLLEKYGSVEGDTLVVGACRYRYVILPEMEGLDGSTAELLDEFILGGGKLFLQGTCPAYVDGMPAELGYRSNTDPEEMLGDRFRISDPGTAIRCTLRHGPEGDFLYAVNLSENETYHVTYTIRTEGLRRYDPMTDTVVPVFFRREGTDCVLPLTFAPGDSFVILLGAGDSAEEAHPLPEMRSLGTGVRIVDCDPNFLTIDYAALSYDGVSWTDPLPIMALSDRLLRERTNRRVYLRYTFFIEKMPATLKLEAEDMALAGVTLNGKQLGMAKGGVLDSANLTADILPCVEEGRNEIVFAVDYYQPEHVYNVFSGVYYLHDGTTETLINCLAYQTNIEDIWLLGDLGVVAPGLTKGEGDTRICDGGFRVTKSAKEIDAGDLAGSGMPFFSGNITFEKEIEATGNETVLRLRGRWAIAEIRVGEEKRSLMFSDTADITGMLKPGRNTLRITLTCARRNTLGPLHTAQAPELMSVGPDTFTMYGGWENGKNSRYTPRYGFTFFGLSDIEVG